LLTVSCEKTSTESGSGTLSAQIGIDPASSGFIASGDTLVGDQVMFEGRVMSGGSEVPSSGLEFTSDNSDVVEILNSSTGQALLKQVGSARVTVTFESPSLENRAEPLTAFMDVSVSEYEVELSLRSSVTDTPVDSANALVEDTVQVVAQVRLNGATVPSGGLTITRSSDTGVANPNLPSLADDEAALVGVGQANLVVQMTQPAIPGGGLLSDSINVNVESLIIELKVESLVPGSGSDHLNVNGDTLVTDSVQFSGIVIEAGNDTTPITSATWTSSNTSAVRITDSAAGIGTFDGVGTAVVSVTFDDPVVPINTDSMIVPVTTYVTSLDLQSFYTGSDTDTLVTDSVGVGVDVTKNGAPQAELLATTESSDSSIVAIIDGPAGEVLFADTGQAWVYVTLAQPTLPRAVLRDSIDLEISTYVAAISDPGTPVMGDSLDYDVTVTDTRGDTTIATYTADFQTSDATVIEIVTAATGRAFARDIGTATVSVDLVAPALPNPDSTISDALAPTTITEERFYGTFSTLSGDFGDTVIVRGSQVHTFTDSTRIFFPNGTVLFADTSWTDSLRAVVGAGSEVGQLLFYNLLADGSPDRDSVPSIDTFTGGGTVADPFEPNDTFPLTTADSIGLPFEVFLSIDPAKTNPIDNNFFYFFMTAGADVTATAEWQQVANIDFYVCSGNGNPPTDIIAICQLTGAATDTTGIETDTGNIGAGGPYVLRVWCEDSCPAVPLTYKLTVRQ
jgi:hypothetical protein